MKRGTNLRYILLSAVSGICGAIFVLSVLLVKPQLALHLIAPATAVRGSQQGNSITAQRFVLVDEAGRTRATLENDGLETRLLLISPITKAEASLSVSDETDPLDELVAGKKRPSGTSRLQLWHGGKDSVDAALSTEAAAQETSLELSRNGGDGRLLARVYEGGTTLDIDSPLLTRRPSGEGARIDVSNQTGNISITDTLNLSDKNGNTRAVLGGAQLETLRTGAQEQTGPSSIVLFDKKGKVIWQAP